MTEGQGLFLPAIKNPMHFAPELAVPLQAAASRFAILGKSGSGKSNADAVLVEEMVRGGVPVVVFDVLGNMWGLRSSGDGTAEGLSIAILGGLHGDVPLRADRGAYVADMVAEGVTTLVDLSQFDRDSQQEFVADFLPRLMSRCQRNMHVVFEEADTFAPERPSSKSHARARSASTVFARTSRNSGIGWTMSTQRPQLLSKEVIDSADVLIAMKMTGDLAQAAIGAEVKSRAGARLSQQIMTELPALQRGGAWFVPDADWLDDAPSVPQRFRFRWRNTFDSARPPRIGEVRDDPKVLATIDLELIRAAMTPEPEPEPTSEQDAGGKQSAADIARRLAAAEDAGYRRGVEEATRTAQDRLFLIRDVLEKSEGMLRAARLGLPSDASVAVAPAVMPAQAFEPHRHSAGVETTSALPEPTSRRSVPLGNRILDALVWWKRLGVDQASRLQVGLVAGVKPSGGHFMAVLSSLKAAGKIDYPSQGLISLTAIGASEASEPASQPNRSELIALARAAITDNSQLRIFDAVVSANTALTREQVADAIGVAGTGGHFMGSISSLVKLGFLHIPARGQVALSDLFNHD